MSPASHLLSDYGEPPDEIQKLARARRVLAGLNGDGIRVHASMFDPDVISFAHGEGIRRPHPSVIAAGVRALLDTKESSIENYLFLQRLKALDEKIAASFIEEGIDEQTARNICIDSGTTRLFLGFLYAVANPGDIFLVAPTFYHPLASWCHICRIKLICVQTQRRNDYKLTKEDMEAWYERYVEGNGLCMPRGVFIFNPTQTGGLYTKQELQDLADFISEKDLVVLADSIFMNIEFDETYKTYHLASFEGMSDRVVTINGGSKAYSLANIRIGWGCGPIEIIERMNAYSVGTSATTPYIAKAMALAALNAPKSYLERNVKECRERVELVINLIAKANATLNAAFDTGSKTSFIEIEHVPKAGHSILLSFNSLMGLRLPDGRTIKDSVDLTRFFLSEAGVAVSPGLSSGFDDCKIRLSLGCVGLEYTYDETQNAEVAAAIEEALRHTYAPLTRQHLCDLLSAVGIPTAVFYSENDNAGFVKGRLKIEDGLTGRIVPAIIRLIAQNRTACEMSRSCGSILNV